MKHLYLPESMYDLDLEMNTEKLFYMYENQISITGCVVRLDIKNQFLEVDLGGNLIGLMPFKDATIYPIFNDEYGVSPNIHSLIGKKIRAKIISFDSSNIFISRKQNMLETLEVLKHQTCFEFAQITGFSRQSAFFDVGSGIMGRSYGKEFSKVKFRDIQDVGVTKGDLVCVKVIEFFDTENKFELSRVDALPSCQDIFNPGDVVICTVFEAATDPLGEGHFALIDNSYCGIVDSPEIKLDYGDKVEAHIRKVTDKGIKLKASQRIICDDESCIF